MSPAANGPAVEATSKALVPIFQDQDPFFSRSPHVSLLWALEVLAWAPQFLAEAAITLAKLARIDPGGKLTNRPLNSLREIFLSWHPGTNANLVQRMAALDQVIAEEQDVGWKLVVDPREKRPRARRFRILIPNGSEWITLLR